MIFRNCSLNTPPPWLRAQKIDRGGEVLNRIGRYALDLPIYQTQECVCACGVQLFSVNSARSVVAGAVYFRKCRLCPGAEFDKSSARKANTGAKCGEFVVLLKYINRMRSSVVVAHFKSCL